jgi:diguanylate cyclase (GGDEF)-like protein/PAS domain S-box-containing protein
MQTNGHAPLANVMDLLLDAICVVDVQGRFVFVSAACERIFGYRPDEMIGRPMIDLVFPDDRARTLGAVDEIVAGRNQPNFENRYVRKDGRIVHIMWSARWSQADQVRVAVARDVTDRKRSESMQAAVYAISEAAHAAEDLIALFERTHQIISSLLPALNFFVALYDPTLDQLTFPYFVDEHDPALAPIKRDSGSPTAEVVRTGQALLLTSDDASILPARIHPDVGITAIDWLGVPLNSQAGIIGALVVKSHAGDTRYTEADAELLKFVSTQVATAIERKRAENWLLHVAQHDPLTDLPNRNLVRDRVVTALARVRRDRTQLSLLYLDLDRFKQVNDRFGHAVGDALLKEVAHRLKLCVRESDTVGRMGGDEFAVLLVGLHSPEEALPVAEKIRLALIRPFDLADPPLAISPSIGIAHCPGHGDDWQQMIDRADEAMYAAKLAGGNGLQIYRAVGDAVL